MNLCEKKSHIDYRWLCCTPCIGALSNACHLSLCPLQHQCQVRSIKCLALTVLLICSLFGATNSVNNIDVYPISQGKKCKQFIAPFDAIIPFLIESVEFYFHYCNLHYSISTLPV